MKKKPNLVSTIMNNLKTCKFTKKIDLNHTEGKDLIQMVSSSWNINFNYYDDGD